MYERFKELRRKIALDIEVPAYMVFSDKSLKEFASKLPVTKEQMIDINGVGLVKFEKYGEEFLELSKALKEEFSKELENHTPLKNLQKHI